MGKFIVISIDSGKILAREKNPDLKPLYHPKYYDQLNAWKWKEYSLKTYPLSEDSLEKLQQTNLTQHDLPLKIFLIGEEIEGEVINNEIVIK